MKVALALLLSYNLLLLLIPSLQTSAAGYLAHNENDMLALLALKERISDPEGIMNSWNRTIRFCEWPGVSCSHRHKDRVVTLDLNGKKLGGSITSHICNLTFLRHLDLGSNNFQSSIPQEIGSLFRLRFLNLSDNAFHGEIPSNLSLCFNLRVLDLIDNQLSGSLSVALLKVGKLERFYLAGNYLSGQIPPWLGNYSSLLSLSLSWNSFEGSIPAELGQLPKLRFLQLASNNLSGRIPSPIYNISSLHFLSVTQNHLQGDVPQDIGLTLPNLNELYLGSNQFYGPIPDSLANGSSITLLNFDYNDFSGTVPPNLGSIKGLQHLGLSNNKLETKEGEGLGFLTFLTNCSGLQLLDLESNNFRGELPASVANLSNQLKGFSFAGNQISGNIPEGIGNLVSLTALFFWGNLITGELPVTIGKLESLSILDLSHNKISGSIPSSVGNLTQLLTLDMEGNNLEGAIPTTFGNLLNLEKLFLDNNILTGKIPKEVFSYSKIQTINFAQNFLTGPLPPEVGNMSKLVELDVSQNRIFGGIPAALGDCLMLEQLNLQNNLLEGSIPASLATLKSLQVLDLSRNNLSGQIPYFLQNFTMLQKLNLSFNNFEGKVPEEGVFKNETKIFIMGNPKLCGGIKKLGLPSCKIQAVKKHKRLLPLKTVILITVSCGILAVALLSGFFCLRKSRSISSRTSQREEGFPKISYAELIQATNEFSSSNLIGEGSFGSVYKGILGVEKLPVAVKVLNLKQKGATKSFVAECEALRNIRHRNLVKIQTVCSSIDFKGNDFKALVYEFMQNGSLHEWLHPPEGQIGASNFNFIQKLNIAIDVASAVEYLHYHCEPSIVHGDLKPSNVLLDNEMVAHVADFGLARFLPKNPQSYSSQNQSSSVGIKGTVGYVAPEYGLGGKVSMAGDVYSFGILLLEIITGKQPTDDSLKDGLNLHQFTKSALPKRLMEIVAPSLLQEAEAFEMEKTNRKRGVSLLESLAAVAGIGVLCSMESPADRIEMKTVVAKLCIIREKFLGTRI